MPAEAVTTPSTNHVRLGSDFDDTPNDATTAPCHHDVLCCLRVCLQLSLSHLPKCQITRLQQIQNSLARAVVKAPKLSHTTPILRSLHWLKITERIE